MSKTIREYLEELPEPYRTQALINYSVLGFASVGKQPNIVEALMKAFNWNHSSERHDYWENLYYYLLESDELIKEANQILNK